MNRRTFLRKTFYTCSLLSLGQGLWPDLQALAYASSTAQIVNIRRYFHNDRESNQVYLRIVVDISAKCEIVKTQTDKYAQILIKNCSVDKFSGSFDYASQFTTQCDIQQVNRSDVQMRISLAQVAPQPEIRCFLLPPAVSSDCYRVTVDIGDFSQPTALKELNLRIKETNLTFKPLETRAETDLIVVHHVGGTDRDVAAEEIHQWHLANGWSGIGYHYVIRKNGSIERGRPRDAVGAHTYGHNENSLGIVIVGDFESATPRPAQLKSAAQLIAVLCHMYKLSPNDDTIFGHRDLNDTLCPGCNLYDKLEPLRKNVLTYM